MVVLPLYNTLLVPDTTVCLQAEFVKNLIGKAPVEQEKVIILVLKDNYRKSEFKPECFYPIGISSVITEVSSSGLVLFHNKCRVSIDSVRVLKDKSIKVKVTELADIDDTNPKVEENTLRTIKNMIVKHSEGTQWALIMRTYMGDWGSVARVASSLSPWLLNTSEERYALLEESRMGKRTLLMAKMIYENLEGLRVNMDAINAQKEETDQIIRESAIKRQISYLQSELDELNPENVSDAKRFERLIEECGMNEQAKKEAIKTLDRFKQEHGGSQEAALLYDYLDFLLGLPWKDEEIKGIDIESAKKVLDKEHYGLLKVKRRIIHQIAVMRLKGENNGSILCFVGPPGTGKTSIGASIAKALGREYIRVSLGGIRDEADIRGHRRTYVGAMAGRIMNGISKAGVNNPVMVLDEVDKMASSYNGDPGAALLEVLDPEQNSNFTDHYLNVPFDLSKVFFICTANSMETIPAPLLNRMEVIRFDGYTPIEKQKIAKNHLIPKAFELNGISKEQLFVSTDAVKTIIREYTKESGVRGLKKRLDEICREAAVRIVEDMDSKGNSLSAPQKVTGKNLKDYLTGHPLHDKSVKKKAEPGVVTGLAYTSVGGDILYMETKFVKGKEDVVITGQLGEVMTESVKVAITLVKSIFPKKAERFKDQILHVHVPDGATPKDGPSAGITLTVALASLVNEKAVNPAIAMTGEVSLQGDVKAIGGLTEKLMAAERGGVKKVFIPKDNEEDLSDVPKEIQKALEIIPVSTVKEVLKLISIIE